MSQPHVEGSWEKAENLHIGSWIHQARLVRIYVVAQRFWLCSLLCNSVALLSRMYFTCSWACSIFSVVGIVDLQWRDRIRDYSIPRVHEGQASWNGFSTSISSIPAPFGRWASYVLEETNWNVYWIILSLLQVLSLTRFHPIMLFTANCVVNHDHLG